MQINAQNVVFCAFAKDLIIMKKIAVFASGTGSNAVNLVQYFSTKKDMEIALLLSNKANAPVIDKMKALGVPTVVVTNEKFEDSSYMLSLLREYDISFIILAGFLKIIPPFLTETFDNKIINIHPSLLPKYGGKGMYGMKVHEAVVAAGDKESGITIHYLNNRYDEGEVIFQAVCEVTTDDTAEDVAKKVHALEYEHYPKVAEKILQSIKN
ncbi:MAG: phosphoribosylglycinamide formyltransferase [Bacteroidales bacterium]|nr:phosphoribosylglycinamide formyltransferase [Bacteroidales bacterium]